MSVNAVSIGMNGTQWGAYKQKLSEATKAKLAELNIPYNDNMTEAQARSLINEALQKQEQSKNNNFNGQNNQTPKDPLFEQAKQLAMKLGISVKEDANFLDLLTEIEDALEKKIKENQNNVDMLYELKAYSSQLATLQQMTSQGPTSANPTNEALMMSLEMLSQYNQSLLNK